MMLQNGKRKISLKTGSVRCHLIALALFCFYEQDSVAQSEQWLSVHGPLGGSVNSIVIDSANTLYAATQYHSVLRSTNNGDTWMPTNFPAGADVSVLAIGGGSRIYAGTSNGGVFKTTDGGQSWIPIGLTNLPITSLAIGDGGEIVAGAQYEGVYRTTDEGQTWTYQGLVNLLIRSVVIDSAGVIFVGVHDLGAFRSTDHGTTWTWIVTGFYDYTSVTALAFDRNHTLYAGTYKFGLWKSVDQGDTWTGLGSISSNIQSIAFDADNNILLGSNDGVTMSTDGGRVWVNADTICRNVHVSSLVVNSRNMIIAGAMWRGFSRSIDGGKSWTRINTGFAHADISSLAWNGRSTVYAGVTWDGVYATDDNGMTWRQIWPSTCQVVALAANDSVILAAPTNGYYGIYRSVDGGLNWVQTSLSGGVYSSVVIAPNGRAYAGGRTVFASTDNGATWTATTLNHSVYCLAVNASNHLFVGSDGIFRSTDDGQTWNAVANFNATIVSIAIDRNGAIFTADANNLLYCSSDNGGTWLPTGHGIGSGIYISALAIGGDNSLIAGTNAGVYRSLDSGRTWSVLLDGMESRQVQSLLAGPNGYLYSGIYKGSIYRTLNPLTSVESESSHPPLQCALAQNYPNPFNPSTTISFRLPSRSHVALKIFDVMGRDVATIVSDVLPAGTYQRQWDAAGLPSGVYFYRLQAGAYTETKRLVLMK